MTCPKCGEVLADNATTCSFCGEAVNPAPQPTYENPDPQPGYDVPVVEEKHENVVGGTVGALIGALLGGAVIILLSQLGYVASISGLIMAICALKGYELLGGKLSTKGIIISILFILIVPYFAYRLDWAFVTMRELPEYDLDLAQAFRAFPQLIALEMIDKAAVMKDLLMLYGFTALGAVGTIMNAFKKKK